MKMNKKTKYYVANQKMAELLLADVHLLSLFERLGMRLGFGEASVGDICGRYAISPDLFLALCDLYSFGDSMPQIDSLGRADLPVIVALLRASHRDYTKRYFPAVHAHIHCIVEELDKASRDVLNRFYDDYDAELNKHFDYEDKVVFPYIESLLAGTRIESDYSIELFAKSHSNIEEKLNDLKNIIIKYLPETCLAAERLAVLRDIFLIEEDLVSHTAIENRLLIPLVAKLEKEQ